MLSAVAYHHAPRALCDGEPAMRLATWNCSMALHRKLDAMLRLQPDIAVICECADPDRLKALAGSLRIGADTVALGDNRDDGLPAVAFHGVAVLVAARLTGTSRHV